MRQLVVEMVDDCLEEIAQWRDEADDALFAIQQPLLDPEDEREFTRLLSAVLNG